MITPFSSFFSILASFFILTPTSSEKYFDNNMSTVDNPMYMITYDHGGLILWGTDHFEERLDNAVEWLNTYPGFKIGLDNEAYVYDYLSENQPELLGKIQQYLKTYNGRFGIGSCTYGQPLSTFIGEESNIRQIGYALETNMKYFNYENKVYLMSEHAMHAQIPQILKGFGFEGAIMRTHYMMYGYNPTYDEPFGWWKGMDGSSIPTIPTYKGEGAAFGKTPVDNWILTRYPGPDAQLSLKDFRKQFNHINPLLATRADDSDLRKEDLVKEYEGNKSYQWILLDELLSLYPEPKAEFKTQPDDFSVRMPWGYCGNEIWNKSRETEVKLLTTERLAVLDFLINGKNYEKKLDNAWKHLLLAQHHDIQIVGLLPDARQHLNISLNESGSVQQQVLEDLARNVKGEGTRQVLVFNPLSWSRKQWVTTKVQFKRGQAKDVAVYCGKERVVSTILNANRFSSGYIMECEIAFQANLDNIGLKVYTLNPLIEIESADAAAINVDYEKLQINTPFYDLQLFENGGIKSLFNKKTGKHIFRSGTRSAYLTGLIDGKDCESAGKWIISKVDRESPWLIATEYGFIADIPYTIQLKIEVDSPLLDWKVTTQLDSQRIGELSDNQRESVSPFIHEKKLRFKFYSNLDNPSRGIRDLPFVIAETNDKYIQGNYWTAVEDNTKGMAVFNKGTMCLVNEEDGGNSIPLIYAMYYIWGTRMLKGEYEYEFVLLPYTGNWRTAEIHKKAISYNFPFIYKTTNSQNGTYGPDLKILDIQSNDVILSALYINNGKVITRMYDCSGSQSEISIVNRINSDRIVETDLTGNKINEVGDTITFGPWQIKTFELIR